MNIKIEGYQVTFREEKSRNICTPGKNLSVILATIETVGSLTGLSKTKTMRDAGITC